MLVIQPGIRIPSPCTHPFPQPPHALFETTCLRQKKPVWSKDASHQPGTWLVAVVIFPVSRAVRHRKASNSLPSGGSTAHCNGQVTSDQREATAEGSGVDGTQDVVRCRMRLWHTHGRMHADHHHHHPLPSFLCRYSLDSHFPGRGSASLIHAGRVCTSIRWECAIRHGAGGVGMWYVRSWDWNGRETMSGEGGRGLGAPICEACSYFFV
jgi:hypothetical protein